VSAGPVVVDTGVVMAAADADDAWHARAAEVLQARDAHRLLLPTEAAWRNRRRREGAPAMSHMIGRPDDDLLEVMLGDGADPEQVFIGGSPQALEEGDGFEDRPPGDEPTLPEL
jgi:hypothetical protein